MERTEWAQQGSRVQLGQLEGLVQGYRTDFSSSSEFFAQAVSALTGDIAGLSRRVEQGFEIFEERSLGSSRLDATAKALEERSLNIDSRIGAIEAQLWLVRTESSREKSWFSSAAPSTSQTPRFDIQADPATVQPSQKALWTASPHSDGPADAGAVSATRALWTHPSCGTSPTRSAGSTTASSGAALLSTSYGASPRMGSRGILSD